MQQPGQTCQPLPRLQHIESGKKEDSSAPSACYCLLEFSRAWLLSLVIGYFAEGQRKQRTPRHPELTAIAVVLVVGGIAGDAHFLVETGLGPGEGS